MSIAKNKALAGLTTAEFAASTDNSSSVVVWESVFIGTTEYTFCQYIITTEAGSPKYIRDEEHKTIVRPIGHDYYPCHNGSTYGLYDKVNHTFTAKTVTSFGDDEPYGVGIWDLTWATASGFTDLLALIAADGGTQAWVDAEHTAWEPMTILQTRTPEGGSPTQKLIPLAFYLDNNVPILSSKTVVENGVNVTYTYERNSAPSGVENTQLIKGRKPRWNLFADGNPVRTEEYAYPIGVDTYAYKLRYAIFDGNESDILKKWHGYNASQVHVPFAEFSGDNAWPIEFHNGVFVQCSHTNKLITALNYDNHCIFKLSDTVTNIPELHLGLGNLINWDSTIGNPDKVNFYFIRAYVDIPLWSGFTERLITSRTLYWNGQIDGTPPANGKFDSNTPTEAKLRARDGKNIDDSYFNWAATSNVRTIPALYNVLYYAVNNTVQGETIVLPQSSGAPYGTSHTIELDEYIVNKPLNIKGNFDPIVNTPPPISLMGKNFRMILRTPTITFGGTTYNIINGVYRDTPASNIPNQFYWQQSASNYVKSGIGMTFLYATDANVVAANTNDCICILELTTCATDGTILSYILAAKHRSQGVWHKLGSDTYIAGYHDPDIDYRDSPLTYTSGDSFDPVYLCDAKLPYDNKVLRDIDTEDLYTATELEQMYTNKVMFFYDEFPAFADAKIVDGSTVTLRPDTTAVIGMYSNISALILGGITSSIPIVTEGTFVYFSQGNLASIAGISGYKLSVTANNHWLLVYGYNGVLNKNTINTNKIYFKRYTSTDTALDSGTTPNSSYSVQYVLLATDGTNSAGAYFVPNGTNVWKLSDGTQSDMILLGTKHLYASLTYVRIESDKCFPTPDGKLTDNGIFELNIWSDDIVDLSIIKWGLQKY